MVDLRWCDRFNDWVDRHSLLEIELCRSFTGANNQSKVVMNIDRIFYCSEFDTHFPLSLARALLSP
jgi:hypothetical protein